MPLRRRWIPLAIAVPLGTSLLFAQAQVPTKRPPAAGGGTPTMLDGHDWIKVPPGGTFPDDATQEIPKDDVYEVVASKHSVPIVRDLTSRSFEKLTMTTDSAEWYTGPYFRCPEGKTPYLVRAVFGHGATGQYSLKRAGRKLLVEHGSLGHNSDIAIKSALVVNLDFEPEVIYIVRHIAE